MTENKGLYLEQMFREFIIPHIKRTKLDTKDEVSATLSVNDIDRIDSRYIKNQTTRLINKKVKEKLLNGQAPTQEEIDVLRANTEESLRSSLADLGNERFFKPSELDDKTWKEQFKDLEWELEIDITGEQRQVQSEMTTLATALKVITDPNYAQNKQAQMVVGKILEMSGAMSPLELQHMQATPIPAQPVPDSSPPEVPTPALPNNR